MTMLFFSRPFRYKRPKIEDKPDFAMFTTPGNLAVARLLRSVIRQLNSETKPADIVKEFCTRFKEVERKHPQITDTAVRDETLEQVGIPIDLKQQLISRAMNVMTTQLQIMVGFRSKLCREELIRYHELQSAVSRSERTSVRFCIVMQTFPFFARCVEVLRTLRDSGTCRVQITHVYDRIQGEVCERGTIPRRV